MPELGTAWVSLTISTRNMERDIKRSFQQAEKSAKLAPEVDTGKMSRKATSAGRLFGDQFNRSARVAPEVDTSRMGSRATAAGQEFGSRFSAGAKTALGALGAASVVSTLADQFRQVMSVGMDWTKNMNTLRAVTGASAEQMKAAGAAARQLGTDVSLPATSANDAAAAMTELAKGGFSVEQSMTAARGSLQLAAAAGISAGEAATIQSSALQAFGLGAESAGKISDTLANAANASSAEITDVAQALQQAGTVANQFGLSAQDTAASIALLANNGIRGSDAGTLLKSALLALTDQGNPAQGAIEELGLTVYDATGRFVGMRDLLGQLGEASKRMTPEAYQAATATLFGSDAMRLAGVAAKDGSASYDLMRSAIERQGAAADVAAAKTQGLPRAWERVKNSLESLQLKVYDSIEGPISGLLDGLSKALDGFSKVGDSSAFTSIADAVKSAAPGLKDIAISLGKAVGAIGVAAWKAFSVVLEAAAAALQIISPLLNGLGSLLKANQGLVTAFVGAWAAFKFAPAVLGRVSDAFTPLSNAIRNINPGLRGMRDGVTSAKDGWSTLVTYMQQANPQMSTAQARMGVLKSEASRLGSGLKTAGAGLVGMLGGPLNIALMGAVTAFGLVEAKNAAAAAAAEGYRQAVKASADAQVSLNDALLKSNGLMDEAARAEAQKKVQAAQGELDAGSQSTASFLDQFRDESGSLLGGITDWNRGTLGEQKDTAARVAGEAAAAIDNLKLSQEALAAQVTGDLPTFEALVASLERQGEGGLVASEKLKAVREDILGAQQAGATAGPVLAKLGDDVAQSAANIKTAFAALPTDVPIKVDAPGGEAVLDLLKRLGAEVTTNNDKQIVVAAPLAPEVLETLKALGIEVVTNNDKTITVTQSGAEAASEAIDQAAKDREATIRVLVDTAAAGVQAGLDIGVGGRADGAIVAMASGGLRQIRKPRSADIYAGRGAGTIFAEEETGGEAYIPLAPGKRGRSTKILAEVARLFGLQVMADGGLTVDEVKAFASRINGRKYVWGGGAGNTFDTDCSGAQSTLVNAITGASGRFTTASQAQALTARGFQAGDPPPGISAYWVGWVNGGPGGGHTAGTIVDPLGGNVNVEMGGAAGEGQFGGGAAGATSFPNRAWIALAGGDDPNSATPTSAVRSAAASVTSARSRVTSAQARLDQAQAAVDEAEATGADASKRAVAEKRRDAAQQALDAAMEKQTAAEQRLAEVKEKQATTTTREAAGGQGLDGQSIGQSIMGGILSTIGLDGSVFSNPFDWANVRSGMALANWGGGLLQSLGGAQDPMLGGGPGMPGVVDMIKPLQPTATQPVTNGAPHGTTGAEPGPGIVVNGNIGMDPRQFTQRIDAHQNQAWRRNMTAVRPQ